MMRGLLFQNEHTLWVAITSSLLPSEVLASPVQASVSKEGALTVVPSVNLPKKVLTQLQELGVRDSAAKPTRSASCWAELLSVERTTDPESDHTQVLFVLPSDQSLLALAGEMLRLGCDKQEYRISDKQFFLRVTAPPYYTLTKALDRVDGLRAFIPSPRGQDRIWVEIGYRHPLTSLLRPAKGNFLLVTSDGDFVPHAEGGFQDLYQLIDLVVPAREVQAVLKPLKSRIQVPLRFSHSGTLETPTLWVLKENAIEQIDAMLQSLPEIVTGTLLFSAARIDNDDVIVLRVRPGIKRPPQLEVRGEAFAVHPLISNLFVPTGVTLEPPLRRDRVRDLLAPKPDAISWLWPLNRTDFRVESIIEKSFAPLEQWLDYVIHGGAQELAPWVQSTVFAWDEFEAVSGEFVASSKKEEKERKPKKEEKPTRESKDSVQEKPAAQVDPKSKVENKRKEPPRVVIDVAPKDENVQATVNELLALEKRFLSLQGEADSLERLNLWTHMGTLNARLARARDAGLCWVHSVWEQDIETSLPVMQAWTTMETSPASIAKKKAEVWALSAPQSENVRALAVVFMYERFTNVAISQDELQRYSNFFDKYDDCLDLRTLWLLRHSLSQSLGGDRLGLARTRDRILTKLHRGLSVERDVPAFLRFISGGRDTNQVEALSTQLQVSLEAFDKIKRNRSAVEASPALTRPYIQLIVAYGYARLGQSEKARALVKVAQASLPQTDPIHSFISRAYVSRIESALEGLPSDQPLPPALEGELNKVEKFSRYKIDRLRQYSNILEQNENIDAVKGFQLGHADPRGEKFAGLRGMTDSAALFVELERIVRQTISQPAAIRADDFDSALDFFPRITEVQAVPLLEAILQNIDDITPEKRARIYRDVLSVAGHFSNEPIVKRVLQNFTPLLASLGAEHVAQVGTMVSESLRSLRRVGLREEASALLDTLSQVAQGRTTPMLAARLHFAGGSAFLGHTEKAIPIFEEAQRALEAPATAMLIPDRLHITRALCRSLSQTSQEYAIASLRKVLDHLPKISDSFNTNSHFSLSVLAFYESLVLGLASDELTLGEVGRRWLDEDEYLIRRRIHHDLSRVR